MESDTERGSTDGATRLVTSAAPESFVNASLDHTSDPHTDTPKPRIPKVTSDSFISELVSDREPAKVSRDVGSAAPPTLEEETILGEGGHRPAPCAGVARSPGDPRDPQWSNVDLGEAQAHQAQTGVGQDSADTCSLSSVATYTLAMEDPYGTDEHPVWAWVSGGGCSVDSHSQLSWFNCSVNTSCELNTKKLCHLLISIPAYENTLRDVCYPCLFLFWFSFPPPAMVQSVQSMTLSVTPAQTAAWRRQIFEQLSERTKREMDNFRHYEQAIEQVHVL